MYRSTAIKLVLLNSALVLAGCSSSNEKSTERGRTGAGMFIFYGGGGTVVNNGGSRSVPISRTPSVISRGGFGRGGVGIS
jgi:hypothetical protein